MMENPFQFADILEAFTHRAGYNTSQLARLSGLPQKTVENWIKGRVHRPREQTDLLKLAKVLRLNAAEAAQLFAAAQYPMMELLARPAAVGPEDDALIASWQQELVQSPTPFQSTAVLPYFVGRQKELTFIKQALTADSCTRMCSLHGMGGVGKTALASRVAHELRHYFPDGVLWASVDRSDTASILKTFARACGLTYDATLDLDSFGRMVRELLASKRLLIVIDNARHSEEIRPLLPASHLCAVLITTRRQNLAITSGIQRLDLTGFSQNGKDALALFECLLGARYAEQHAGVLEQIAHLLGYLPLAVAIAAKRLAYEPGWTPAEFLKRLQPEEKRLTELTYENQSVRRALTESFNHLLPPHWQIMSAIYRLGSRRVFNLENAARGSQQSLEDTADQLRYLYDFSVVQRVGTHGYQLHPLVRAYLGWVEISNAFRWVFPKYKA
jgi:transcriptional regulator with XRE-family HTH domain